MFFLWCQFVRISNGYANPFQIPFEISTICEPTSFQPLKSILVRISDPHGSAYNPDLAPIYTLHGIVY